MQRGVETLPSFLLKSFRSSLFQKGCGVQGGDETSATFLSPILTVKRPTVILLRKNRWNLTPRRILKTISRVLGRRFQWCWLVEVGAGMSPPMAEGRSGSVWNRGNPLPIPAKGFRFDRLVAYGKAAGDFQFLLPPARLHDCSATDSSKKLRIVCGGFTPCTPENLF